MFSLLTGATSLATNVETRKGLVGPLDAKKNALQPQNLPTKQNENKKTH